MGWHPQQLLSSSAFLRAPFSAHCSSSCIQRPFSILPRSSGFSFTGMQTTYNSMITVSPVIQPRSPSVSLIASRPWANGCPATASSCMHRKRSSSGWVRLAAWPDAPSTRSSSVAFQYNHPPRSVTSVLTSILAWVIRIMSTGWRERASSTFVSSGLSVGRSLWILRTPWFGHWSWRDWITATGSLAGHQSISSARCLVSCGLQLVWFCCFLVPAVSITRSAPYCTGLMFRRG